MVREWIEEKLKAIESTEKLKIKSDQNEIDSEDYNDRLESILASVEVKFEELSKTHNPGNIQLVNSANYTKLIQLLIVLRDLQTTHKKGMPPNQLFKSFSSSDIASLLQQHFCHFQNKKINTVQKEITAVNSAMDDNQERIKKLNKALVEFFW
jgi:hypothetical protein